MKPMRYNPPKEDYIRELCDFSTVHRLHGGFKLDVSSLPNGGHLYPLAPLSVDIKTRTATPLVRAKVVKAGGSNKKLQVAKGSPISVGMFLSDGTTTLEVKAINTREKGYDEITAKADTSAFTEVGAVLFEASDDSSNTPKATANFLSYQSVRLEASATITAIAQAYEVKEDKLYIPLTEADKESLTSRFLFT